MPGSTWTAGAHAPAPTLCEGEGATISLFRDARDVIPRREALRYDRLAALLAPADPPVRADISGDVTHRERYIDDLARRLLAGRGGPPDDPTWRALEKAAWTAGGDVAAIEAKAAELREAARRRAKTRLPCWSPAIYRPGATRGVEGVEAVSCLVLDYDDGTTIEQALEPWHFWPLLLHTSWSHTPEKPRFRLVLALEAPVPAALWLRAWRWAAERSAGTVDPACKDPSRLYLLPARPNFGALYLCHEHDPGGWMLRIDAQRLPEEAPRRAPGTTTDRISLAARMRLRVDGEARRRVALHLGASVGGRRAEHIRCPGCERPSVWFWLDPGAQSTAQCAHRRSCGWWGHLDELLDRRGAGHGE